MAGLDPAIHVFTNLTEDVDARHETEHDAPGRSHARHPLDTRQS